ncbi:hypothetical protein FOL47_003600 [Perkinsus chesapeaki]|uniref:Cyclic nucleotide-binding domain-containing protein n=1 Tax=Perkinsus chesapeaki TaxID=330153 RepID=A0A7J6M8A1_PERCH|nr:hypothetical protein FOL47_003600 [Perkinsus chesapeaki]
MVLGKGTGGIPGTINGFLPAGTDLGGYQSLLAAIEKGVAKTLKEMSVDILEAVAEDQSTMIDKSLSRLLDAKLEPVLRQLTALQNHFGIASPEPPPQLVKISSARTSTVEEPPGGDGQAATSNGNPTRQGSTLAALGGILAVKARAKAVKMKRASMMQDTGEQTEQPAAVSAAKFATTANTPKKDSTAAQTTKRSATIHDTATVKIEVKEPPEAGDKTPESPKTSKLKSFGGIVFKGSQDKVAPFTGVVPEATTAAADKKPPTSEPRPPEEAPPKLLPGTVPEEEQPDEGKKPSARKRSKAKKVSVEPEGGEKEGTVFFGEDEPMLAKRASRKTADDGKEAAERATTPRREDGNKGNRLNVSEGNEGVGGEQKADVSRPSVSRARPSMMMQRSTSLKKTGASLMSAPTEATKQKNQFDGGEETLADGKVVDDETVTNGEAEEGSKISILARRYKEELEVEEEAIIRDALGAERARSILGGARKSHHGSSHHRTKRLKRDELEEMMSSSDEDEGDLEYRRQMLRRSFTSIFRDPLSAAKNAARLAAFDPHSQIRLVWDLIISTFHIYQAVTIPFSLAFYQSEAERLDSDIMQFLPIQDAVFAVNIIVTFLTGFYSNGALVRDPKVLALRYLKSWFILDVIGAFPYLVFRSETSVCQWLRLLRLLIVGRTGYLRHQIMSRIEYKVQNEMLFILLGIAKLVTLLILVAHWGACIWWSVGVSGYLSGNGPEGWIPEFGLEYTDLWTASRAEQYTACLYFMTSTITTVGYGDIHAYSHSERVFCIICEILAGNLFALFSGLLCSLILTYDEVGAQFRGRLKTAMRYMNRHNVDNGVQQQVRQFIERLFQNQANEQAKGDLLTLLRTSEGLQSRVLVGVMGKLLRNYKWFDVKLTDAQLGRIASIVLTKYFAPGDLVFYAGDKAESMIFLVKGLIKCKREKTTNDSAPLPAGEDKPEKSDSADKLDTWASYLALNDPALNKEPVRRTSLRGSIYGFNKNITALVPGDYVGEKALFTSEYEWPDIAVCTTFCEVYELDREAFVEKCVNVMPDLHELYLEKCLFMVVDGIGPNPGGDLMEEKVKHVEELIIEGASANATDEYNCHVICKPALHGHAEVLLLLLGAEARVNYFYKPEGDLTNSSKAGMHHQGQNAGEVHRDNKLMKSPSMMGSFVEAGNAPERQQDPEIYGTQMASNRLTPLQMTLRSNNTAAVAVLARNSDLFFLQKEEGKHPLAALHFHGLHHASEPSLDPVAPILEAPLAMRYQVEMNVQNEWHRSLSVGYPQQVLAAAVMQGCQAITLRIITDAMEKEQRTGEKFDIMRTFYCYEVEGQPIVPAFRIPLTTRQLSEKYGHDTEGRNLIHLAAESGEVGMLEFLINTKLFPMPKALEAYTEPNPDPHVEMPMLAQGAGHTPLHLAAIRGNLDIVTSLVDAGVNISIMNRMGQTILDLAMKYGQDEVINYIRAFDLYDAAKQGDMTIFENLDPNKKEHVAKSNLETDVWEDERLIIILLPFLLKSVNSHHPKTGSTPLYIAAGSGQIEVIKKLIELKAEVDKPMPSTFTALHGAVSAGHTEAVRVLLDIGHADPTRPVGSVDVEKGQLGITPLETALKKGKKEVIDLLYERIGVDGVVVDDLRAAAQKKNFEFIDAVIAAHPPLLNESKNLLGETLANAAVKSLDEKALEELASRGVDFGTARTQDGHSTLYSACKANKEKAVKWLLGPKGGCKEVLMEEDYLESFEVACGCLKSKGVVTLLMPLVKISGDQEGKYYANCLQKSLEVGNSDVCLLLIEKVIEKIDFKYVAPWGSFLLYYVSKIGDPGGLRKILGILVPDFDSLGPFASDARRVVADELIDALELSVSETALQVAKAKVDEKLEHTPDDKKLVKEQTKLEELLDIITDCETALLEIADEQKMNHTDSHLGSSTPRSGDRKGTRLLGSASGTTKSRAGIFSQLQSNLM